MLEAPADLGAQHAETTILAAEAPVPKTCYSLKRTAPSFGTAALRTVGIPPWSDAFPDPGGWIGQSGPFARSFMTDVLGIRLKPEVMPLSNLAGAYPPFLLKPDRLLALR